MLEFFEHDFAENYYFVVPDEMEKLDRNDCYTPFCPFAEKRNLCTCISAKVRLKSQQLLRVNVI